MTDVLSGRVDPSGKLATTFPAAYADVPGAKDFPGKEFPEKATPGAFGRSVPAEVVYNEGIYVGYRYYNTFKVKPAYAFGYGLSYTHFSYGDLKLSGPTFTGRMVATVTITNSGTVAGKEVAELYVSAPHKMLDKPAEELKGFAKTRLLRPGESQTLEFVLSGADLASFDSQQSAWVTDGGEYEVRIGGSSEDIKSAKTFSVPETIVVEHVNKALTPQVSIEELKSGGTGAGGSSGGGGSGNGSGVAGSGSESGVAGADYFPGKWKVTIFGTPNGDVSLYLLLDRKDGKLSGTVHDSTDKEMTKLTQVEEKDKNITVYFTAQGYDVNMTLEPVPADAVKGSLMSMFDVKGVRVKE